MNTKQVENDVLNDIARAYLWCAINHVTLQYDDGSVSAYASDVLIGRGSDVISAVSDAETFMTMIVKMR